MCCGDCDAGMLADVVCVSTGGVSELVGWNQSLDCMGQADEQWTR